MNPEELKSKAFHIIESLDGWCSQSRAEKLIDLVLEHEPITAVELGVYGGRSLVAMGMAMGTLGRCAVGIDPWTNDANLEGEPDEHQKFWQELDIESIYERFVQNMISFQLLSSCRWIRSRGEEAVRLYPDASIDLFSLDGNHRELSSCRDIELWAPKIAPGGHLIMDDTGWRSMQKAVGMVKERGFSVVHEGGGWTVFRR
jgi:hypothetical protein